MASTQISKTRLYSVYEMVVAENKNQPKQQLNTTNLASVLESRKKAQVSTNWQREVGIVPQAAYSEGQYVLTLKSGKQIKVAESFEEIGTRVWDCAALMGRWFEKGDFVRGKNILEMGAGTGLLGFACAVLGARRVVITDLQKIYKAMDKNIKLTNLGDVCTARALDWNDVDAIRKLKEEFGPFDMIVASDVLVFAGDARVDGNGGLIRALTLLGEPETTEILMGCNKNRQGFIDGFLAHPPTHLFDIQTVGKDEVDPEYFTDKIMLYRMRLRSTPGTL